MTYINVKINFVKGIIGTITYEKGTICTMTYTKVTVDYTMRNIDSIFYIKGNRVLLPVISI